MSDKLVRALVTLDNNAHNRAFSGYRGATKERVAPIQRHIISSPDDIIVAIEYPVRGGLSRRTIIVDKHAAQVVGSPTCWSRLLRSQARCE